MRNTTITCDKCGLKIPEDPFMGVLNIDLCELHFCINCKEKLIDWVGREIVQRRRSKMCEV